MSKVTQPTNGEIFTETVPAQRCVTDKGDGTIINKEWYSATEFRYGVSFEGKAQILYFHPEEVEIQ